jgi:hypothetical protein
VRNTILHFEVNSETAITQRLDSMSELSRELLKCCAVMGHHFTPELVGDLMPRSKKGGKDV